jgi:SAM-dependent methyltransferase
MLGQTESQEALRGKSAVRAMYERYPYPSPISGDSLIEDVANGLYAMFGERSLQGWRVLDAGCGTGHRLVGVARRYPEADFTGIDMTAASLDVARDLARKHGVGNLRFEQGDISHLSVSGEFDLVICTGVIVHQADPARCLESLASRLAPEGILFVWLYNAVGEHERLLDRELLHLMIGPESGVDGAVEVMRELGLGLEVVRYGSSASQQPDEVSQLNIDVDAYVHPIVKVFRFDEAIDLFRGCPQLGWAAIHSINLVGASSLIDLAEAEQSEMRYFCQSVDDLFPKDSLRRRFRGLETMQKLRAMEIKLKPTGFTILGGRAQSYRALGSRIIGNTCVFERDAVAR